MYSFSFPKHVATIWCPVFGTALYSSTGTRYRKTNGKDRSGLFVFGNEMTDKRGHGGKMLRQLASFLGQTACVCGAVPFIKRDASGAFWGSMVNIRVADEDLDPSCGTNCLSKQSKSGVGGLMSSTEASATAALM